MLTVDYVILIIGALSVLIGAGLGFGKGLKILGSGFIGRIITLVFCYFIFGLVASWPFVQELLNKFTSFLSQKDNFICKALITIRIDMIVLALALFFAVGLIKKLVLGIVASIFEADVGVMRFINKTLGVVFFVFTAIIITLITFQIIAWVNGEYGTFYQSIAGSALRIDNVFINNPLNSIFRSLK